tara:strand:- start:914 stop:1153 length:240 start_codon:yes stop_codon:yes gene_type:complete
MNFDMHPSTEKSIEGYLEGTDLCGVTPQVLHWLETAMANYSYCKDILERVEQIQHGIVEKAEKEKEAEDEDFFLAEDSP